jgi:hypothetical protein
MALASSSEPACKFPEYLISNPGTSRTSFRFQMGLKEPEHDGDCCEKAEVSGVSIPAAGQYTYYGYMYASSEEEVVNRGLKDVLLVPGFDIKY